jgi:hypothetical protein
MSSPDGYDLAKAYKNALSFKGASVIVVPITKKLGNLIQK